MYTNGPRYGITRARSTASPISNGSSIRRFASLYVQYPSESQSTKAKNASPLRIACWVPELRKLASVTAASCR